MLGKLRHSSRHCHNPSDFERIERLRQYVIAAKVEDFRPKRFIRDMGRDDQPRRFAHQVFPVSIRQRSFVDHHGIAGKSSY